MRTFISRKRSIDNAKYLNFWQLGCPRVVFVSVQNWRANYEKKSKGQITRLACVLEVRDMWRNTVGKPLFKARRPRFSREGPHHAWLRKMWLRDVSCYWPYRALYEKGEAPAQAQRSSREVSPVFGVIAPIQFGRFFLPAWIKGDFQVSYGDSC